MTSATRDPTSRSRSQGPGGISRVRQERQTQALYRDIIRPDRVYPIVGLSCQYHRADPPMSPQRVREVIWESVPIYIIESRESRALEKLLNGLGAYNGALRVWWPGVDPDSEQGWHPLIYDSTGEYGEEAIQQLAEVFAHRPPNSTDELSEQERTILALRSVPRPQNTVGQHSATVIPLSTRKDLRRLTTDLRSDREYPIVVLTIESGKNEPTFPPVAICGAIDPKVPIYILGTDDLCRRLAQTLGDELAVKGGDARILWPGARTGANPAEHPLVAAVSREPGAPADRLIAALQLSQPSVRVHVAALRERAQRADAQSTGTLRELRAAGSERAGLIARVETAEQERDEAQTRLAALTDAGVDSSEVELIAALDLDGRLHRLIFREWLKALTSPGERDSYPLRYVFGGSFIETVGELTGTSLQRIAWVAAMVACGRASTIAGIDPHQLRQNSSGSSGQVVRDDGAKGWRCKLNGEGASRLHYWQRPDGIAELAAVGVHDAIGQGT